MERLLSILVNVMILGCVVSRIADGSDVYAQTTDWQTFERQVFEIAELVVQNVAQEDDLAKEEIASLQEKLAQLEMQSESMIEQCPSSDACASIQYILTTAKQITDFLPDKDFPSEEEKGLALLRQAIHNYRTGPYSQKVSESSSKQNSPLKFQIGYAYRASTGNTFQDLKNGSMMHFGDLYKVFFISGQDCYVYILQVSSSGRVSGLFPLEIIEGQQANFIRPKQTYFVPDQKKSFTVSGQPGKETIYFLAFHESDSEFEAFYKDLIKVQNHSISPAADAVGVVSDTPPAQPMPQSEEEQQIFLQLRQYLEGSCQGCIQKLTFTHEP